MKALYEPLLKITRSRATQWAASKAKGITMVVPKGVRITRNAKTFLREEGFKWKKEKVAKMSKDDLKDYLRKRGFVL